MKVLILGATGPTGRLVVGAARRAGHEITVLVRNPSAFDAAALRDAAFEGATDLRVVVGDATSPADVAQALEGQDAMISALGAGRSMKSSIASTAAAVFVPLAEQLGVHRVVVLSAFGVGSTLQTASTRQRLIFTLAMKNVFADKAVADAELRASGLDWTLIYPVTLNDKAATGAVGVREGIPMKGIPSVSRADVAEQLVAALERPEWYQRTLTVA